MVQDLIGKIETALGIKVGETRSLGVGFGLTGLRLKLADGRQCAVKAGQTKREGHLLLEAYMLRELAAHSKLPVPEVYYADEEMLVMEWLGEGSGTIDSAVERRAAELLAQLHQTPRTCFGYARDTVIGPLPQPNNMGNLWLPFFRDLRLLHMAELAREEGALPPALFKRLENLAGKLGEFIDEPEHPSLLHGDLWTGNIVVDRNGLAGFIDPAIYYGHREIELAFTTMFHTFGREFFDAYEALYPLEPGFHETRCDLYNLYPTLVHVRLFGASYLASVEQTLSKLGF